MFRSSPVFDVGHIVGQFVGRRLVQIEARTLQNCMYLTTDPARFLEAYRTLCTDPNGEIRALLEIRVIGLPGEKAKSS